MAAEVPGRLVHKTPNEGGLSRRAAFLAAIPPALLGLGVAVLLLSWVAPGHIVLGGATPHPEYCFHDWGPDFVASAIRLGSLAAVGLTLTGGALVALTRRLPPWAGPWLSTTAAARWGWGRLRARLVAI